jgi:hypothetical protein
MFRRTYHLHLQGLRVCYVNNQQEVEPTYGLLLAEYLLELLLKPEDGGRTFHRNVREVPSTTNIPNRWYSSETKLVVTHCL